MGRTYQKSRLFLGLSVEDNLYLAVLGVQKGHLRPVRLRGRDRFLSASAGVALSGGGRGSYRPERLLREADIALYAAKNAGKNRMVTFEPGLRLNRPATTTAAPASSTPSSSQRRRWVIASPIATAAIPR